MGIRTGQDYRAHLAAHPREVWLRGERIDDVSTHPAFAAPIEQIARLYDMQHDPALRDALTYESPATGNRVAMSFMVPRTREDLAKRREAFRLCAEANFGLMGRTPDFLNATVMAMAEGQDFFARAGERFAANIRAYYEYIRENDLFLTHALITPQNDRSKSSAQQADDAIHLRVVRETEDGVIVSGARMLGTHGPTADEVLVYNLPGLKPGDEPFSIVFALPVDTPGIKQICREPFVNGTETSFDNPMSSRFEEPDALFVFDNVLVPWNRVFLYNDVALANAMYPETNIRQHTAHQTSVRGLVKMQFIGGIAVALAQSVKTDAFLHVQQMLGECLQYIEVVRSCIVAAEAEYEAGISGSIRPAFQPLQTVRTLMPTFYPRMAEIVQTLGAGALLTMPSGEDFASPIAPLIDRYYRGAEGLASVDRIRLYKLAWDMVGHSFGSRLTQYERYYAGDPVRNTAGVYFAFDKAPLKSLVDGALALAGDPPAARQLAAAK
jgi:anthranilate 3-monooxygenase (FAD)/4-hydroxyphenylacetate 3-monooxygenase